MAARSPLLLSLALATLLGSGPLQAAPPLQLRTPAPVWSTGKAVDNGLRVVAVPHQQLPAVRRQLQEAGVPVLAHLPPSALLIGGGALPARLTGISAVAAWTPVQAVQPELAAMTGDQARRFTAGVPVLLGLAGPAGQDRLLLAQLTGAGAQVSWIGPSATVTEAGVLVPAAHLAAVQDLLLASSSLVWADLQPPLRLRNTYTAWLCQTGEAERTDLFLRGLRGQDQVIGLMDTGIDIDSCYFYDHVNGLPALNDHQGTSVDLHQRKVLAVDFWYPGDWPDPGLLQWDSQGHGSHVAGTAAGYTVEQVWSGVYNGMAPRARLVVQDGGYAVDDCGDLPGLGCPVQDLEPMLQQAYDQGARIHTNSWGDEESISPYNRYTERTADIDRFCWHHRDLLVLFAAGNQGSGWDSIGSPATGKNVIAVGATVHGSIDPPCIASFSSRGWTEDGRIKPDLVVPGRHIWSAASDSHIATFSCRSVAKSGTSMAAPAAAGLAALVRQYFSQGYYPGGRFMSGTPFTPSAALLKATLIAAAVDLTTLGCSEVAPIPSRDQGWGLVRLDRALAFNNSSFTLLIDDHHQGFTGSDEPPVVLEVAQHETGPLKVVLVWTDAPSSSLAAFNLVNNLDLSVRGPDGLFLGNVFDGTGVSSQGGEADQLNNVEVVWLPDARPGLWRIKVAAALISEAPQGFALVVTSHRGVPGPRRLGARRASAVQPGATGGAGQAPTLDLHGAPNAGLPGCSSASAAGGAAAPPG